MAIKDYEIDFTEQDWVELGKELEKWAGYGPVWKWGTIKSTEPVDIYLEERFGAVKYVSYEDVDFKENKLAYNTFKDITRMQELEKLGDVNLEIIMKGCRKFKHKAELCPNCDLKKIAKIKSINKPKWRKLEKLCEKYLYSIDVIRYIGGERK